MTSGFETSFRFGSELGKGAFGTVHKVVSLADSKYYALKILELRKGSPEFQLMLRECYIMMALIHPNIVRIIDNHEVTPEGGGLSRIGIQLEFCHGGDLHKYIKERICRPISVKKMKKWMMQLASALAYIHEKTIIHRDIKPQNIFLDKRSNLKIGDFGVSREMQFTMAKTLIGTPAFMAPEAMYGEYGIEADVFSLGCVYICMAALCEFPKKTNGSLCDLPKTYGEEINTIILRCTDCERRKRPKASEIVDLLNNLDSDTSSSLNSSRNSLLSERFEERTERFEERTDYQSLVQNDLRSGLFGDTEIPEDTLRWSSTLVAQDSIQRRSVQVTRDEPRSKLLFHSIHGTNITLNANKTSASRNSDSLLDGVVFTNRPVRAEELVVLEISEINTVNNVLLAFGFTECDPSDIQGPVPRTVHDVSEEIPCWKAVRYERLKPGYQFTFFYREDGSIFSRCKENEDFRRENQVIHKSSDVWAMFGVSFQLLAVSIKDQGETVESAASEEQIETESTMFKEEEFEMLYPEEAADFRTSDFGTEPGTSASAAASAITEDEKEEERDVFLPFSRREKKAERVKRTASCYSYIGSNITQDNEEEKDVLKPLEFQYGEVRRRSADVRNRSRSDPTRRHSYHRDTPSLAHVNVGRLKNKWESDA